MTRPLVLVANDPPLYREALAAALHEERPRIDAVVVDPGDLERDIARYRPDLAICSQLTATVRAQVPSWVLLSPDNDTAVTSLVGERHAASHFTLAALVALIDHAT